MKYRIKFCFYLEVVRQMYQQVKLIHNDIRIFQVYEELVELNVIETDGRPTQEAIQSGRLEILCETPDMSFEEFIKVYPVFTNYNKEGFIFENQFWEMKEELFHRVQVDRQEHKFNSLELKQINQYFEDRKMIEE
ncbi:hypothetical protein HZY91_06585 [Facklamia sp. DSM 111018]|uniref:Protein kinase domain-containing protein n=1 Tax=Facklamia lactis TaxID=2749967 RepID=A0ABS0LR99_9LACT|nr:hypothetical protein [Facklamia lactis]MBG9980748.1 hypothetical protein [Facklamia lactis]MBG9986562.1 hypothetical protein [Facklamia lactis]